MLFQKQRGKEVRNYKSTTSNGKTILDITPEPRQIQSRLGGWIDIDVEYTDVKSVTDILEEKLTDTQRSRRKEYNDLQSNFYAHRMRGRIILDTDTATVDTFGIKPHIEDKLVLNNKKHLPREFIWLEGAETISGVIELPYDDYSHVYVASGDYNNPDITFISEGKDGDKRPYYQKREGKTFIYVDHFSGGGGTQADPYLIHNLTDLNNIRNNLSAYYRLEADIDASDTVNWNSGAGWVPIGSNVLDCFKGVFDGNGYMIDGLYINRTSDYYGFFGYTGNNAQIKNITLTNVDIQSTSSAAGLIGYASLTTVTNCKVTGRIKGLDAGGICYMSQGASQIFDQCFTDCEIAVSRNYGPAAGGLIGYCDSNTTISDCHSSGSILITGARSGYDADVGGLLGYTRGSSVTNCYANVTISAMPGYNTNGAGGLVSNDIQNTTITNSYWDMDIGWATSGGGTGKTTAEMKTQSTYTNWDFTDIWGIDSAKNDGYPYLRVFDVAEQPPGTLQTLTIDLYRSAVCAEANTADTLRQIVVTKSINADTLRQVVQGILEQIGIDTLRKVVVDEVLKGDTLRKSTANESFIGDLARRTVVNETELADTLRQATKAETAIADALRSLTIQEQVLADAKRSTASTEAIYADASRQVTVQEVQQINADTLRVVVKNEAVTSDTKRGTAVAEHIFADTLRVVVLQEVQMINADTLRVLVREETVMGDTTRRTLVNEATTADLIRRTGTGEATTFRAIRHVVVEEVTLIDTLRQTLKHEFLNTDTKRRTVKVEVVNADTLRRIVQGDSVIVSIVELLAEWDVEVELLAEWDVETELEAKWDVEVELEADVMGKENQDFEIKTGCTKILKFTATLPEGKTLQGTTLQWGLYDRRGKEVLSKGVGDGITITGDTTFEVMLTHTETTVLAIETHHHEAKMTDTLGQKSTVAEGTVTVEKGYLN